MALTEPKMDAVTEPEGVSQSVARFVAELMLEDIPEAALIPAKRMLKDWLGGCVAGGSDGDIDKLVTVAKELTGDTRCVLIGRPERTGPQEAAMINGAIGQVLDFDNSSDENMGFVASPTLPALFAAAQMEPVSGADLLVGFVAALETAIKIGKAMTVSHYEQGWHPTFTCGVLGAAAGVARALKLDTGTTLRALSIATTQASGLRSQFGTEIKPVHSGFAARAGLVSVLLARQEVTANPRPLEAPSGFFKTFSGDTSVTGIVMGNPWSLVEPGIKSRIYPCCFCIHRPIDAVLDILSRKAISAEEVESVDCGVSFWVPDAVSYSRPKTPTEGKFSIEYCLSRTLLEGRRPIPTDYTPDMILEPKVVAFIPRINVYIHEELRERGPGYREFAEVAVHLRDGETLTSRIYWPKGTTQNPLSPEELDRKFADCVEPVLDAASIDSFIARLDGLETLEDAAGLIEPLTTT
ncbi:MmgE/PrpD family protein [Celeribacter indicus]|uniref:MmgE/PrpD family protein n=1 Tax=Celeribacter indicus TaxID=1208324 RepID=A0A0B5E2Q1_9RHOB|nr:MmgE/PrpD family protein [Celeribacter indicus]AJE46717.1 hypothetical protein P73_2002 [Celeribacter indicus]SDX04690.1 2-methylcitrate dehydratase PrpD [Celeribacter indicus]